MGCANSSQAKVTTQTQSKVSIALMKIIEENKKSEHIMTLERILLKFEKMHEALTHIKKVYHEFAPTGEMNMTNLKDSLHQLHGIMTDSEVADLFDFVDVDLSRSISLKEFLACLTIGMVLDAFPSLDVTDDSDKSKSDFKSKEIKEMLGLIVSAYLLFDSTGEGYIRRTSVEKILEETGHKAGSNAMLSQQRWKELDWDANGTIDFAEFINSFSAWVDINEDFE